MKNIQENIFAFSTESNISHTIFDKVKISRTMQVITLNIERQIMLNIHSNLKINQKQPSF